MCEFKEVVHDHYAFSLPNWGCGKLPSGEAIYEGEEVVRVVENGRLMSATLARKEGYKFVDDHLSHKQGID